MPLIVNGTTVKHVNVIKDGVTTSLKQIKMSDGTVVFDEAAVAAASESPKQEDK